MKSRQLYRYFFVEDLSTDEIANIPQFFDSYKNKPVVANILRECKTQHVPAIAKILDLELAENPIPENAILEKFQQENQASHYFSHTQFVKNSPLYLKAYLILSTLTELHGRAGDEVKNYAFNLVVLFGDEENPEKMFQAFDEHCESITDKSAPFLPRVFANNLPFRARAAKEIDLTAWRKIIHKPSLESNLPLLAIASEVEAVLGHAPTTLDEANKAAGERVFKDKDKAPVLAALCPKYMIPESSFERFLTKEPNPKEALDSLLRHFPADRKIDALISISADYIPFETLLTYVDDLKEADQEKFFNRRVELTKKFLVNKFIYDVLKIVKSKSGQANFLASLEPEFIKGKIFNVETLKFTCENLHTNLQKAFLIDTLGKVKINSLTEKPAEVLEFMQGCLPKNNRIETLEALFEKEKICFSVTKYSDLESLTNFGAIDLLRFCRDILGKEKTFAILSFAGSLFRLCEFVRALGDQQIIFFFDFLGANATQQLFSQRFYMLKGNLRQPDQFRELLLTEEEKHARECMLKLRQDIIKTNFSLGVYGVPKKGGLNITLDDWTEKTVPTTIHDLWHLVRSTDSVDDLKAAWEEVQNKCTAAAGISMMSSPAKWVSRGNEATEIYNRYKKPEGPGPGLRLKHP